MKKIFTLLALAMISVGMWAEVSISVNPSVIDFGTVNLDKNGEAEGEMTAVLTWSGLIPYCSVYVDTIYVSGADYDNCEFYATAEGGYDYWYGGDEWNAASDPTVYVGYYAIYPGEYTIKYRFYSYNNDDDWYAEINKAGNAELTVKVKVQAIGTDLENVEAGVKARKQVINGQLMIIRGDKMYDLTGKIAQ